MTEITKEKAEIGAKAKSFLNKLQKFDFFFLLNVLITIFERIEVVNAELQTADKSIGQSIAKIFSLLDVLTECRTDEKFNSLWLTLTNDGHTYGIQEPYIKRPRKIPIRISGSETEQYFPASPEDYYRQLYFQILDQCTQSLRKRFDSEAISTVVQLENFALNEDSSYILPDIYDADFDLNRLHLHKTMFFDSAGVKNFKSLSDIVTIFRRKPHLKELLTEFLKLIKLIMTIPCTSCTAERSFSSLRRLKTYLRNTMTQRRLNDITVLNCHRDLTEMVDLDKIAINFIGKNQLRKNIFHM